MQVNKRVTGTDLLQKRLKNIRRNGGRQYFSDESSFAVGGNIPKWVGCILGPTYMIQI